MNCIMNWSRAGVGIGLVDGAVGGVIVGAVVVVLGIV